MPGVSDSILSSTKKALGLDDTYEAFDLDVIMHTNSILARLIQLGVGPEAGFMIEGKTEEWAEFLGEDTNLNPAKTYVFLRVRLLFDPPTTSFLIDAYQKQIVELEWLLNVYRENQLTTT